MLLSSLRLYPAMFAPSVMFAIEAVALANVVDAFNIAPFSICVTVTTLPETEAVI